MCGILGIVGRSAVNQVAVRRRCCCSSTAARTRPASPPARPAVPSPCRRATAWCATSSARATCATLPAARASRHVRYPTAGSASNDEEAQPFYVNAPFGITLAHNGNLTNTAELKEEMFRRDRRHINTDSDSEVLLNVLAHELQEHAKRRHARPGHDLRRGPALQRRVRGAYACVAQIAGYGMLAFRDPYGIRPICYGVNETDAGTEYLVASESVALEGLGFRFVRDIAPGEAIFIDLDGNFHSAAVRARTRRSIPASSSTSTSRGRIR